MLTTYLMSRAPERVPFDIPAFESGYLGRWFQLGASEAVYQNTDPAASCHNHYYDQLRPDVESEGFTFRARQSEVIDSILDGKTKTALIPDPDYASDIELDSPFLFLPSNYLIVGLGEEWISRDDKLSSGYEWAVVTDALRFHTFVLGRYLDAYETNKADIDAVLAESGISTNVFGGYLRAIQWEDHTACPKDPFAPPVIPRDYDFSIYVGMDGEEAKALLEDDILWVLVQILKPGQPATRDYRLDRVRLYVDDDGVVIQEPRVG